MTIADRFAPARCPRLVVKIGSSLLIGPDGAPRRDWLATLVDDVAERRAAGQAVVLVSSGAIALGARTLNLPRGGRASLEDSQAAAACGQIALAGLWAALLAARGLTAAQMLLTLDDLEDRRRYLNAAATLDRLLGLGAVPVLNENDSVATAEIRFGDNDRLAARVAQAAGAAGVILLSDVDGLHTADPARDPAAALIEIVPVVDAAVERLAGAASTLGTGGMAAKLEAARLAARAGVDLAIASGREDHPLHRFAATGRGTLFPAAAGVSRRKAWLASRRTARGRVTVDAGAATALAKGGSLLAAGVTAVEGGFARGDVVEVLGPGGAVARGIAAYDVAEASRIAGHRHEAQAALLGYPPRSALIHRDQLVLL
ncbi:glutamate 5-kinase [uncultured Sphingomonas sp.]|uniref:glutamate 5-kinase n=1 Tax=uncultured Sphingomonas sp. TaxID=158754 RepID=UPI0035CA2EDB